jgi:hypothetical protein
MTDHVAARIHNPVSWNIRVVAVPAEEIGTPILKSILLDALE